MVDIRHVSPKGGDALVMVGTMKGAFLFRSDASRRTWQRGGPYFPGNAVYAMAYDDRAGRRRLWAAPESFHFGAVMRSSDDFGKTWSDGETANVRFPEDTGASLKRVWQIAPARAEEPDVLYAGVEPAALFESRDGGQKWSLVRGLWDHPHRPQWQPGGGGMCLHTVLLDPTRRERIHVAVSTAGVYRTDDGGRSWRTAHKGVRAQFLPNKHPEFGQCVHKISPAAGRPGRMYLQNHWGLYRTDDGGGQWVDIANGVPSDFGFPIVAHPSDPDTAWIIPLTSDGFRCTAEAKARVFRTRDAGESWEPFGDGLPQDDAFLTVLRDGFSSDGADPVGLYFGTRTGELFASSDEGESWKLLASWLPPVMCVKAATVA